ncbi:TetR/AcrR family transcriptional regulator [Arthrobacter sp. I2-34]|uniref:TetR/AcrR family transcriptional regulator n=1 Tax=Arthrobacter hankyongi TaxID=2904801 RepID=A0ABS9L477_9MICC|nr:TetR/AcrR family transcriptional regulator [Arthrobacter hankyongi]MCG2621492.1 TetR/AcrR family transcriptional regulator [Arthrobacter hankyongi]
MARPQNPQRKPQLLADILDYLKDKSLAEVSFRSLAEGLGISSYMLVYHFGTRDQLIAEISDRIYASLGPDLAGDLSALDPAGFRAGLLRFWRRSLQEGNRRLQRLGFEAAVQGADGGGQGRAAAAVYLAWAEAAAGWLRARGLAPAEAGSQGRMLAAGVHGLLYDVVLTGQRQEATAAFEALLDAFLAGLEAARR